jgi:hypothetical protein
MIAPMDRQQASTIQPGDMLYPLGLWNATERTRKLAYPTEVLDVRHEVGCQTGVMLRVRFENGTESYLDAGWFREMKPAAHIIPDLPDYLADCEVDSALGYDVAWTWDVQDDIDRTYRYANIHAVIDEEAGEEGAGGQWVDIGEALQSNIISEYTLGLVADAIERIATDREREDYAP